MKRVFGQYGMVAGAILLFATTLAIPAGATTFQPLTGVRSLTTGFQSSCALFTTGRVDCWGQGDYGQLGNGKFYTTGNEGSAVRVAVKGVGGTATLSDVASLTGDAGDGYCALLTSGKVDCWGYGYFGDLGNGNFYTTGNPGSAVPVAVKGLGGTGILSGVASLTAEGGYGGYCARLISGQVDCWGYGVNGQLGNGTFYTTGKQGSAVPVAVKGLGGAGVLSDVASLTSDGSNGYGFCAILTSGKVDCWGYGENGVLGNGTFYNSGDDGSATPVAVEALGGVGALAGVASLTSDGSGYCAALSTGKVDCWGAGSSGQLGSGTFYNTGNLGSAIPVAVKALGGSAPWLALPASLATTSATALS